MSRHARLVRLPDGRAWPLATIRAAIADARKPPEPTPTLFPLITDARPAGERTAAERYAAPSLFSILDKEPSPCAP